MGEEQPSSYKEIIKQLAAQAPKPYGAIPPLLKKRRKKSSSRHQKELASPETKQPQQEEQQKSSATPDPEQQKPMRRMSHVEDWIVVDSKESLPDEEELIRKSPFQTFLSADFLTQVLPLHMPPPSLSAPSEPIPVPGRPEPSTSTTPSYVMSSSPPQQSDMQQVRWVQTIEQLRRSLVLSSSKGNLIPMPPAPRRPASQRRRSEATTQPRFNPDTNTYTRDTRSNPDHLRIISSELNMIRARKLLSPLKPRGFLPRRKDPFVRGEHRRESRLRNEL
ncbi:hypothetical protein BJV82DRAFT_510196 [Fennellomyces sp. T-0311]|nr:hypothetical protein BJV82DRAFT_510196 [Fennellomyces sp. T-0311]